MIITQTPLRVGLVGGGTDLPSFYREHGGRVLNAAIDKYVYVVVKQRFDDDIYVNYSQKEIVSRVEDLRHDLVREAMHMAGVRHGVEITTLADIPSAGSGLGSSSSVTVGAAAGAVRLPGHPALRPGAGRAGMHDRARSVRQADRQAGPVRRGVRRHLRPAVRTRRHGVGGADPSRTAPAPASPGRADALLQRHHPECRRDPEGADGQRGGRSSPSSASCATSPRARPMRSAQR